MVGPRQSLHTQRIGLRNVNWLGDRPIPAEGAALWVKVRSTSLPQRATLFPSEGGASVLLREGVYGVAAGQACAFYADAGPRARVLGGGWIAQAVGTHEDDLVVGAGSVDRAPAARVGRAR